MEPEWTIGPISTNANLVLAALLSLYTLGIGYNAWRAVINHLEDRWSSVLATGVSAALVAMFWFDGERILPAPFNVVVLIIAAAAIVIMATYTLGRYQEKIQRFQDEAGERLNELLQEMLPSEQLKTIRHWRERFRPDKEMFRKTPHLLMGIFTVTYTALGYLILSGLWTGLVGGTPGTGESAQNLHAAFTHTDAPWLVAGHMFSLTLLLGLFVLVTPNEFLRLRYPELSYPFKQTILRAMRKKEEGLFAAHLYILVALPLAILLLTWDTQLWSVTIPAVIAVLAVTIFGDSASALFGRRYGRRKWPHNVDKTYFGTLAGASTSLLVALPFVGLPMALVTAVVFVVVDALAPIPAPFTDNILNPLALAIAYLLGIAWLAPWIPFY